MFFEQLFFLQILLEEKASFFLFFEGAVGEIPDSGDLSARSVFSSPRFTSEHERVWNPFN